MGETWKVGVIGLGIMGRRMLEHMGRHPAFEVVAGKYANASRLARERWEEGGKRHKSTFSKVP